MARNFTRELRKAHRPGVNRIVCSSAPYEGKEVEYAPRNRHDSLPWVLVLDGKTRHGYRFTGRECHVQTFRYIVQDCGRTYGVVDTETGSFASSGIMSRYAATEYAKRLEASHLVGAGA